MQRRRALLKRREFFRRILFIIALLVLLSIPLFILTRPISNENEQKPQEEYKKQETKEIIKENNILSINNNNNSNSIINPSKYEIYKKSLTIVLMSYPQTKRLHRLLQIIKSILYSWSKEENLVYEILVIWNGPNETIPLELLQLHEKYEKHDRILYKGLGFAPYFHIIPHKNNSLTNRWLISPFIHTEAILNIDDDIEVPYSTARCMFSIWKNSPSSLVAIDVRAVLECKNYSQKCGQYGPFTYAARDGTKKEGFSYNIALPRALISSHLYYNAFAESLYRIVRVPSYQTSTNSIPEREDSVESIVAELLCDDIAFNFAAANATTFMDINKSKEYFHHRENIIKKASPIFVIAPVKVFPESFSAGALTAQVGMKIKRRQCVNRLSMLFSRDEGKTPLRLESQSWQASCSVRE